jgi:hypothetical protein
MLGGIVGADWTEVIATALGAGDKVRRRATLLDQDDQ